MADIPLTMTQFIKALQSLARTAWRLIPASFHWRLLWLANPKFNVGVCGIITNPDGEVLLLRHVVRRANPWGLPSGWAVRGETVEQTLVRELREETGLEIIPGRVLSVRSGFKLRVEVVVAGTLASLDGARFGFEVTEARFFPAQALPANMNPEHRDLINTLAPPLRATRQQGNPQ